MKKIVNIIVICGLFIQSIIAIDFGGLLNSSSGFNIHNKSAELDFSEVLDASAYLKVPFTKDGQSYFATEFLYRMEYLSKKVHNYIDIPLLKFQYSQPIGDTYIDLALGRFYTSDATGKVFSQTSDGFAGSFTSQKFNFGVYIGYTGLVNSKLTGMTTSVTYNVEFPSFYEFSAPYLVTSLSASAPFLFLGQSLGADIWGFIGLQGNKSHHIYGSLTLTGPLYAHLYHNTALTLAGNFREQDKKFGALTSTDITYYFNTLDMALGGKIAYASKDFTTITSTTGTVTAMPWNDIFISGITFTMVPIRPLFLGTEISAIFNGTHFDYKGVQLASTLRWNIFSDVSASVDGSQIFAKDINDWKTNITLKVAMSF